MYNNDLNKLSELSREDHIKHLGVLMDTNLSWKYHVKYVLNKVSKTIGLISKLMQTLCTLTYSSSYL